MSATAEKYVSLLNRFGQGSRIGEEIEATTEEVAQALFCSTRNAKMVVKKLAEDGLIEWRPGGGRGNVSRIVFLAEKEPILLGMGQRMSLNGEYKQAFELLRRHGAGTTAVERFMAWLNGHFGYRSEAAGGSETLETLRFPIYYPIRTLDPALVYYSFDAHMMRQLYDRLVEYDAASGSLKPGLAHFWEANGDATEWTFYLRKGVKFHHGKELDSEDVRFSIERTRGDFPSAWLTRTVIEVECAGPRIVRVRLDRPNAIFPHFTSSSGMSIVPKDAASAEGEAFWTKPSGTGPFRIDDWTEDRCELVANADYFRTRAHLDRVVVASMPEETAGMSDGANWKLILQGQTKSDRDDRVGDDWKTFESLCRGSMLISWNQKKDGPQRSEAFRRAFGLFLNRKRMIRELGEDRIYPARGFRPTEKTPYLSEELDEEAARGLLRESGYAGEPFILCAHGLHEADMRWIERRCAEFGVNVVIRIENKLSIRKEEVISSVDGMLFCLVFAVEDVCEIENYEQKGNFVKECLGEEIREWVSGQIDRVLASQDPAKRRELLDAIEMRLRDESYVTFVLHKKLNASVHPTIKGVGLNSLGWMDFKDIWLDRPPLGG